MSSWIANLARKCRRDNCPMGNQSDKWRVSIRCNSTRLDSAVEAVLRAAVETNSQVRKRHIPMAPVAVVSRLVQTERLDC